MQIYFKTNTLPTKLKFFDLNTSEIEYFIIPRPQPPLPPPPTLEELILHQNDKILWSDLDWVTNLDKKTPKYNHADWKQCKLLGSQLDTQNDINRRKKITIDAMKTLQYIFKSRNISINLKVRTFTAYISSIFLYNSELWSLTKTQENNIDAFHRKQLRHTINIYWPKKITNIELYKLTKTEPWSRTIKRRRLNWLGHMMRLNNSTPVKLALSEFLTPTKKKRGRTQTTWLSVIKKDLEGLNIKLNLNNKSQTLTTLHNITSDRIVWRAFVNALMGTNA